MSDLYYLVLISYGTVLITTTMLIWIIWLLYKAFFKKIYIIKPQNAFPSKREIVKKHLKRFEFVTRVILIIVCIFLIRYSARHLLDLPAVIKNEPIIEIFITTSRDKYGDYFKTRHVMLRSLNKNKETDLDVRSEPILQGECYKIKYFSNIKKGEIISKVNCNEKN